MYLCQFGQNLSIGSEDRYKTRLFNRVIEFGESGDLENEIKIIKI